MKPLIAAGLLITALSGGVIGFTVARGIQPGATPTTVSVVELPSTPTPEPTPSPTATAEVHISDGRGNDGCPSGCDCQNTGSGVIIRCTGG